MDHAALDGELDLSFARLHGYLGVTGFQCAGHGCLLDFHIFPPFLIMQDEQISFVFPPEFYNFLLHYYITCIFFNPIHIPL